MTLQDRTLYIRTFRLIVSLNYMGSSLCRSTHLRYEERRRCGLSGRVADCLRCFEEAGSRHRPLMWVESPWGAATPLPASYLLACST